MEYKDYKCPVCENLFPRDLIVFLNHTNGHILDKIKERHPDWASPEGICPQCVEYYEKLLKK